MTRVPFVVAGACLVLLLAPLATAHAAPAPRAFETRLLHDHNDDSAIVLAGKHGFDAIALDVREARLPTGEDALALRLILNGGCNDGLPTPCPTLRQVVRFDSPSGAQQVAFETADGGASWTGTAAAYVGPEALNDGTRFAVEAWVPFASFGGSPGTRLTGWFVEGYEGEQTADDMPAGAAPGLPDPLGGAFDLGAYTLATREYVRLEAGMADATGVPGATVDVPVRLSNLVALPQDATLTVAGPAALLAGASPADTLDLAPNSTAELVLRISVPNGTAPVNVSVATPLGGFATVTVQATGMAPLPAAAGNETEHHDGHGHDEDKDAPGVGPALVAGALVLGVAARRRRRR